MAGRPNRGKGTLCACDTPRACNTAAASGSRYCLYHTRKGAEAFAEQLATLPTKSATAELPNLGKPLTGLHLDELLGIAAYLAERQPTLFMEARANA
jgi:hypothetical protein